MSIIKLSILIPTYNRCNFLDECLAKLVTRGFNNVECEINVSDNASIDSTKEVVSKYNVNYRRNAINLGYSGNIEALIREARGEYIVILGDDDEFLFDWSYIKTVIEYNYDLYIFGFEKNILDMTDISNKNIDKLPLGFVGDCIQKNTNTFKSRFVNFRGRSNSPQFFARIDVLNSINSKIYYQANEIIRRSESSNKYIKPKQVSVIEKVKKIFIRPLDYTYYWYEARKALKLLYPDDVAKYWIKIIDKSVILSRQKHLQESGPFALMYYWFFQLYYRAFKYPGFAFYIVKVILIAVFINTTQYFNKNNG